MPYKTVIAPKVVMQTSPAQRIVWVVLLIAAFLLAIWFSYDYGRMQSGSGAGDGRLLAQLEQEREEMQDRIEQLELEIRSGETDRDSGTARAIVRALGGIGNDTGADPEPVEAPNAGEPESRKQPAAGEAEPAASKPAAGKPSAVASSNELTLANVRIEPSDDGKRFRFRFSVVLPGNDADQVVGTIWIAVNGMTNGKPVRLSLKQISSQDRPYLDMRFEGRQDVDAELTLPADFYPKNIAIEAKPYDKKYRGASGKFDWESTNRA
jgi:hypothetical protein